MNAEEAYGRSWQTKTRLPELESIIATSAEHICLYARDIIKGRWEEAEATVVKDPQYAYAYANNILKWNKKYIKFYILAIKILWNYLPDDLKNDPDIMTAYFKEAILK